MDYVIKNTYTCCYFKIETLIYFSILCKGEKNNDYTRQYFLKQRVVCFTDKTINLYIESIYNMHRRLQNNSPVLDIVPGVALWRRDVPIYTTYTKLYLVSTSVIIGRRSRVMEVDAVSDERDLTIIHT